MWHCKQGVHDFLRAYFHHKSADWKNNRPHRLVAWSAEELAKMPTYYIMDLADDMATAVAKEMPSPQEIAACRWLPDDELAVYSGECSYRSRGPGSMLRRTLPPIGYHSGMSVTAWPTTWRSRQHSARRLSRR
jgi:hypothetical protein